MKFSIVAELAARHPAKALCQMLRVSRSGYYAWCKRGPSRRQIENDRLMVEIRAAHEHSRATYGYRRVHASLAAKSIACGIHRVRRLMQQNGLRAKRKRRYRTTTESRHRLPIAPNLLDRDFSTTAVNQKWLSDITFVPTLEGWLYISAIIDLYSRLVVGWAMESFLNQELGLKALRMALDGRQPPPGLLHHSDRGVQYANNDYQQLLTDQIAVASMSRTGNVYDNAPMESFFATLKRELIHFRTYRTRDEARADIFEFVEVFYNRQRLHSALGYCSPADFEAGLGAP
jgi:transposase InsO family protein